MPRRFTKTDLINLIRTVCEDLDLWDDYSDSSDSSDSFRPDYSGRAMYGRTCPGIVTGDFDGPTFGVEFALAVQEEGFDARRVFDALGCSRQDNMGRKMIIYWPAVGRLNDDAVIDSVEDPEPEPDPIPADYGDNTGNGPAPEADENDYDSLFAGLPASA